MTDSGELTQPTIAEHAVPRQRLPPTINFTRYRPEYRNQTPPESHAEDTENEDTAHDAEGNNEKVRQVLAAATAQGMQLNSALLHGGDRPAQTSSQSASPGQSEKRQQLMREAAEIRAALRVKEQEIEELD